MISAFGEAIKIIAWWSISLVLFPAGAAGIVVFYRLSQWFLPSHDAPIYIQAPCLIAGGISYVMIFPSIILTLVGLLWLISPMGE